MSIVKVHSQNRGLNIAKTASDKINLRFCVTSATFEILKCPSHKVYSTYIPKLPRNAFKEKREESDTGYCVTAFPEIYLTFIRLF